MGFGTLELSSTVENIFLVVKALPVAYQLVFFSFKTYNGTFLNVDKQRRSCLFQLLSTKGKDQ